MEIVNLFLFILILFFSRKNLFAFVYFVLFFLFCYSRYLIAYFYPDYVLGGEEWVFQGVGVNSIKNYSLFVFIFFAVSFFILLGCRNIRREEIVLKNGGRLFFYFACLLSFVFLFFKSVVLIRVILLDGYLASVDYKLPLWLSLGSSSLAKPIILSLILLSSLNIRSRYFIFSMVLMFLMAMSGQRKDLVSVLLFFLCYTLSFKNYRFIKIALGLSVVLAISMFIFWFREDSFILSRNVLLDLFWSTGFSINSGLFVIEHSHNFNFYDSLGFLNTYIYCGVGKLFSDVCYSDERLSLPGFLLEKIAAGLNFPNETVFGGIGGNLIGSIFVAAGFSNLTQLSSIVNFIFISAVVISFVIFVFCYMRCGVTWALLVSCVLVSSRYAFDGLIPPLNQLIVAVFIDFVFFTRSKRVFTVLNIRS